MNLHLPTRLLTVSLTVALMLPAMVVSAAKPVSGPSLYFTKATTSATTGTNLSVPIRLNAQGTAINALSIVLTIPESQLGYVGLDMSSSYFDAVIPSAPLISGGKVVFSVASLGKGPTSSDVLLGNLIVSPKATSGTAKVSLAGSTAANNGSMVTIATTDTSISLRSGGGKKNNNLTISNLSVTDVSYSGAKLSWETSAPTTSSLVYGTADTYGMSATSDELTTKHSVTLDTPLLAKSVVHYKITAVDGEANQTSTSDKTFTTKGYEIKLTIVDQDGKPIPNATVKMLDGTIVKTDELGIAVLSDLGAGAQKVIVNGSDPQLITVKTTSFEDASVPQTFELVANRTAGAATYLSYLVLFLLTSGVGIIAWRKRVPAQRI